MEWERAGLTPREMFSSAGKYGFVGMAIPEEYGGGGSHDFRFKQVIAEEFAAAGIGGSGLGVTLHNDVCTPYFLEYCNDEQRAALVPRHRLRRADHRDRHDRAGHRIRPGGHRDHRRPRRRRVRPQRREDVHHQRHQRRPRDRRRQDRPDADRHSGMSLLVVERGMPGFERGRNLEKIGLHGQDTAELFFNDVRVPVANRLGEEGKGFRYLSHNLAQERMSIAITGVSMARAALDLDARRTSRSAPRSAQAVGSFQNTKFVLAEVQDRGRRRSGLRRPVRRLALNAGTLAAPRRREAKLFATELQTRVDRPLPAAVRRVRVHDRVPDRARVHRRPRHHASTAARARS